MGLRNYEQMYKSIYTTTKRIKKSFPSPLSSRAPTRNLILHFGAFRLLAVSSKTLWRDFDVFADATNQV